MSSAYSQQAMVAVLAGAFSLATAVTSAMLLKNAKTQLLPNHNKEAHTLYIMQIINGVFAAIGLLVALSMMFKM